MSLPFERCSDTARERGDSPEGTAAPARRWLLVEHPGPWQIDAWGGSGVAGRVREQLDAAAAAAGARILLIRRPGRQTSGPARAWAVLGTSQSGGAGTWGTWESDRDLLAAVPVLGDDDHPAAPTIPPDPVLLVCAHGRHDTCCAVRGRPVAAALHRQWPLLTWECSHVGGDRFAANLVVVPDGVYYGNLDPESAVRVVRDHLGGRVTPEHLRGLTTEHPVAQVAIVEAHRRFGPAGPAAFTGTGVHQLAPDRWRVELRGRAPAPASLVVLVETGARPKALLTCRAVRETSAMSYRVVDVRPG